MFDFGMVMHSSLKDGRHWFYAIDGDTGLQISPVAPNHCRAGYFLAELIAFKLKTLDRVPEALEISTLDVETCPALVRYQPRKNRHGGKVTVHLALLPAPDGARDVICDRDCLFVTPQPPRDWDGENDYNRWIYSIASFLGLEVVSPDKAGDPRAYLAMATRKLQAGLPELFRQYSQQPGDLIFVFRIKLDAQGDEGYGWLKVCSWPEPGRIVGVLVPSPYDLLTFSGGRELDVDVKDLADCIIVTRDARVVDRGVLSRIMVDYGLESLTLL
ncbi:MAG: hypothetical protein Q7T36_04755 [Fluviicoccus sp.]|uniref:hypothetical protein n=1 Tax=Fluviicoccus sp. TaxID=2003552 RepID=UPI00272849A4|nr:hypothetical protein [Fluviicoccus sp.]MDO8329763.1 hypothetical protein [Fluviicoccus sp.]